MAQEFKSAMNFSCFPKQSRLHGHNTNPYEQGTFIARPLKISLKAALLNEGTFATGY